MKCDTSKLSRLQGSSADGELAGPLFPPLHVNDSGNGGLKAPPRNKMALFEQFTVSYRQGLPSCKGMCAEAASQQHFTSDTLKTCTYHTSSPTAELNNIVGGFGKSSCASSLGSLSTCSIVVNVDEPQQSQVQDPEDDTCSLSEPKLGMVLGRGPSRPEKVSKDFTKKYKVAEGVFLSPHVDEKGDACGQAAGLLMKGFHKWDKGFMRGDNSIPKDANSNGQCCQEASINSKGRPYPEANLNIMEIADVSSSIKSISEFQLKSSTDEQALGNALNALEKPVASYHSDIPPVAAQAPISTCDKMKIFIVPPLLAIVKPKDVIHVVGQQLFWKARKAILRQQEVFSNQVFELHKLIEIQKLFAKMPSTLMDECLLSGMDFDKVGLDLHPVKVNSKKQENFIKEAQQPRRCEDPVRETRPVQRFSCEEREGEVVGLEPQTKRPAQHSCIPQAKTNAPFSQAHHFSSSNKDSAWGFPLASLNRPYIYPPAAGHCPSGSGYGGAYVVGSSQPMAPFTFPCYTPRPEQHPAMFCHTNQWSTLLYHPFLAPTANDWFRMNHAGQVLLASCSEKPGPIPSVPSINMKTGASSQTVQPAVVPLLRGQQFGSSNCTNLVTANSIGSVATASVSTPQNTLSGNPSGGSRFHSKVSGAFEGETRQTIGGRGLSKDTKKEVLSTKEKAQLPHLSREEGLDSDRSHALKFPLQPLNSSGVANEGQVQGDGHHGRVIKAIPRPALAASESAAGILRSIQRERQQ